MAIKANRNAMSSRDEYIIRYIIKIIFIYDIHTDKKQVV